MGRTITDSTNAAEYQRVREYWREHKTLFGLIKWYRVVRTEVVREEICLKVDIMPPYVMVNNTRYVPEKNNANNR
jgi:hypothetical protein